MYKGLSTTRLPDVKKLTVCAKVPLSDLLKIRLTGGQDLVGGLGGLGALKGVLRRWLKEFSAKKLGVGRGVESTRLNARVAVGLWKSGVAIPERRRQFRLFLRVVLILDATNVPLKAKKRKLCTTSSFPAFSERACVLIG